MPYTTSVFELKITTLVRPCLAWRKVQLVSVVLTVASIPCLASGPNQVKGSVEGQPLNQSAKALPGIRLQALNSAGVERDACQSDGSGSFILNLPSEDVLYRLIVWDEYNRWWGRDISDLHNDPRHNDLGSITLRPQTASNLSESERREQGSVISWLKKHNPLSAALMEFHLGAFDQPGQTPNVQVAGSGSANATPLQSAWAADYQQQHPNVSIAYQAVGSGGGIRQVTTGNIDYSSTDIAFTDAELSDSKYRLRQMPIALGATVVIYSDKLPANLRFSGPVLARIYLGEIKTWNDKELAAINPGKDLPNLPIAPIHRADGGGSTAVLTRYLTATSSLWREVEGSSPQIAWKAGIGAKGNEGVSTTVHATEGAIGYVDFAFAEINHLRSASIQNASERFVSASPKSISAVAIGVGPKLDLRDSLKKSLSPEAYPMSSATWMAVATNPPDPRKTLVLLDYINLSLAQTRSKEQELGYVPLPPSLESEVKRELNEIAAELLQKATLQL
jgi:phosphate transport system substrate-binding protein